MEPKFDAPSSKDTDPTPQKGDDSSRAAEDKSAIEKEHQAVDKARQDREASQHSKQEHQSIDEARDQREQSQDVKKNQVFDNETGALAEDLRNVAQLPEQKAGILRRLLDGANSLLGREQASTQPPPNLESDGIPPVEPMDPSSSSNPKLQEELVKLADKLTHLTPEEMAQEIEIARQQGLSEQYLRQFAEAYAKRKLQTSVVDQLRPPSEGPVGRDDVENTRPMEDAPGSFKNTITSIRRAILAAPSANSKQFLQRLEASGIPKEALPNDMTTEGVHNWMVRIYAAYTKLGPERAEAMWRQYRQQAENQPDKDQKANMFHEMVEDLFENINPDELLPVTPMATAPVTAAQQTADERTRKLIEDRIKPIEVALGGGDSEDAEGEAAQEAPDQMDAWQKETEKDFVNRVVLGEKRQELINKYKKLEDYDIGPHLSPEVREQNGTKMQQKIIEDLNDYISTQDYQARLARKEEQFRDERKSYGRKPVETIRPPAHKKEEITISTLTVRSGGIPFDIEIWAAKNEPEGSYEDQRAKFMWALRKFEQAEAIAAQSSTSLENNTVQTILQDVQYAVKALEDSPNQGNKDIGTLIFTELQARLSLYQAYVGYFTEGTIEVAFKAVKPLTMKYWNNYFRGTNHEDLRPFITYGNRRKTQKKYVEGRGIVDTLTIPPQGVIDLEADEEKDAFSEKKYEKAPVADALAYIDNFSEEYMKAKYTGQREFKDKLALQLAEVYLDQGELDDLKHDSKAKIDRMVWAVELAEKLFHLSTRYGIRNTMAGDKRGEYKYIGGDEGVSFGTTRTSHLGFTDFDDTGREYPEGEIGYDGCGVNSWLNTKQNTYQNYPMLLRGIDLKCQDFFTFMSGEVEGVFQRKFSANNKQLTINVVDKHKERIVNWLNKRKAEEEAKIRKGESGKPEAYRLEGELSLDFAYKTPGLTDVLGTLEAKRVMGVPYDQDYIAIYDEDAGKDGKGRYFKPKDGEEWSKRLDEYNKGVSRERGLRAYSWKRSRFNLANVKWDEIQFDKMETNVFNIKYWYYGQYYMDELRKGLIANTDSFVRNPSYDHLKPLKDVWQDTNMDDPVAGQAKLFANMLDLLMHNKSERHRSSTIDQEQADDMWVKAKADGLLISDSQSQRVAVKAMGGMRQVLWKRSQYYFDLIGFIMSLVSGTLGEAFKLPRA